jgi:hypothetical protein
MPSSMLEMLKRWCRFAVSFLIDVIVARRDSGVPAR